MQISDLDDDGLNQLAFLHRSVMHTLLSDLGLPIVLKYYLIARSELPVIGICTLDVSHQIAGWAVGSPDPSAINLKLREPLIWFLAQMVRIAVRRPRVFKQLISSILFSSSETDVKPGAIELTYIGVAAARQGMGLGRALLEKFVEESRLKGYHSVVLSVEEENNAAVALYEKSGFKIIKSFAEGRYRRYRMELSLA